MNDEFEKTMRQRSSASYSSAKTVRHRSKSFSLSSLRKSKKEIDKIKENHHKIISDLYYHLNTKEKEKIEYNPEKRLFYNFNYKIKPEKPYVKILTESQYYEKMVISELIEQLNIDYFFSKTKDKLFNKKNIEEVINKKLFKNKEKFNFDKLKKGGTGNLKEAGDALLKVLHIFDAKHDFENNNLIKSYINQMYYDFINSPSSSFTPNQQDILTSLYRRNGANYEEMILQYIVLFQNEMFDDYDEYNDNIIYIDVNADADKFEYFSKKNKDKQKREEIDINADNQQSVYQALINIIKKFYDFNGPPDKYGYVYDTNIHTQYKGLENTYHNIKEGVFDKISKQLFPFENAYDPHSSTKIEIPAGEFQTYNDITDINFNQNYPNEYYSAIRNLTRSYLNFNTIKLDNLYYPNIKLNKYNLTEIKGIINTLQITQNSKTYIENSIFNFNNLQQPNSSYTQYNLNFNLDNDNKINIVYQTSFNSIDILKIFIEKFINYKNEKDAYDDLILNTSTGASFNKSSELWLLYVLVIYLLISNNNSFLKKKAEIISILFDLKKSGDWCQSLFCSKYNDIKSDKEAYFISGDKLSAARSILNGNVKTITATDYYILDMNITNIKDVAKIDNKKKSILTLYNGKNKFKFEDLYQLIYGSIFDFYAFNDIDIDENNKLFNFDENIFNNFKQSPSFNINNGVIIDNTNFNFDYFWYFMIIIIYHIRTYIDTYSVFENIGDGFKELSYLNNRLIFDYNNRIEELGKIIQLSSLSTNKIYRIFADNEIPYKIMQFDKHIFEEKKDLSILVSYLKIIDNTSQIKFNRDLDKKYIIDIVNILKEVFGDAVIPAYNYGGSLCFCEYLQQIYTTLYGNSALMNYAIFLKFFKKFAKLIRLCQILYIDNITKGTNDDEKIPFNTIHTIIQTSNHQPKTICKIIIDKFYNDICLLYNCFQQATEKIGDDVYINSLKTILLSYSSFQDRINYLDTNILNPLYNLKLKLDELNAAIINYNSSNQPQLKTIINQNGDYTILLSLCSYKSIENYSINLIKDESEYSADEHTIKAKFDELKNIYELTSLIKPEIKLDIINPGVSLKNDLLNKYYNIFVNSDIDKFFEQLNSIKEILNDLKFNNKFMARIKKIKEEGLLNNNDIDILSNSFFNIKKTIPKSPKVIFLEKIDEINLNKNNPIFKTLCKDFLKYFQENLNNFTIPYNKYENIKNRKKEKNFLSKFFLTFRDYYYNLSNSLIKTIDYKLYEFFNTSVLSYFVLKDYYGKIDDNLLNSVQEHYINAIKPIEIRKIFKDTNTDFQYIYNEFLENRRKLEEHLNIVRLNIKTIYKIDKSSGLSKLSPHPAFITNRTFFYPKERDIKIPSAAPRISSRQSAAPPAKDANKSIIKIHKLKVKNWYINSRAYNEIYKLLTNNKEEFKLQKEDFELTAEKIEIIYQSIFKGTGEKTFFAPQLEVNKNEKGELKSYDINAFFQNTGFILMVSYILEETLKKYTFAIKNITEIIDPNKRLQINSFLTTIENNYYNNDKYKLIAIIGSYTKHMILKKMEYINSSKNSYNIYRFDKLFRTQIFPNSKQRIDDISNMLDTLIIFSKSKYLKDAIIDDDMDIDEVDNSFMNKYLQSLDSVKLLSDTEAIQAIPQSQLQQTRPRKTNQKRQLSPPQPSIQPPSIQPLPSIQQPSIQPQSIQPQSIQQPSIQPQSIQPQSIQSSIQPQSIQPLPVKKQKQQPQQQPQQQPAKKQKAQSQKQQPQSQRSQRNKPPVDYNKLSKFGLR